jgi:hypothetical protein
MPWNNFVSLLLLQSWQTKKLAILTFGHFDGLDATRHYLAQLDATWRYSTLLDAARRCSTLHDAARRYLTLLDAFRRYLVLLDATRRHDYYSIWFNFSAAFFISEKKTGVIKLKKHFIHLVPCHEMLIIILNCWYIRNIIKYFLNNKIKN